MMEMAEVSMDLDNFGDQQDIRFIGGRSNESKNYSSREHNDILDIIESSAYDAPVGSELFKCVHLDPNFIYCSEHMYIVFLKRRLSPSIFWFCNTVYDAKYIYH